MRLTYADRMTSSSVLPPPAARPSRVEALQMKAYRGLAARGQAMPVDRDEYPQWTMTVRATWLLAPRLRRLTFAAEEFRTFTPQGCDEYFGLLTPPPGRALVMPDPAALNARRAVGRIPEDVRPDLRWYTVAEHRPSVGEIDVDVVVHDHAGPAGTWARTARPGDVAGFRTGTGAYRLPAAGESHLVVGDETAVPSIAAALAAQRRTPRGGRMDVVLEVPGRDHVPALEVPEGATLTVLHRGDAVPGALLTPHLEDLPAAPRDHVWACGEQSLATAARRVIVRRGIAPKRAIMFSGYWRVDGPRL